MPKPRNIPIDMVKGADKVVQLMFDDKPDLTGALITLTIKRHVTDEQPILAKGIDLTKSTNLVNGECWFTFEPSEVANLEPRTYIYELKVKIGDDVIVPLVGDFYLYDSLTR